MIKLHRLILAGYFATLVPFGVFAEAPVVDDSENFALLDAEQQADYAQPARAGRAAFEANEPAFARETVSSNPQGDNAVVLLNKLQGLQQDVQELRGQLETQAHDLKLLQQQQLAFYKDLDARVRGGTDKTAASGSSNGPTLAIGEPAPPKAVPVTSPAKVTQPVVAPVANNTSRANPADEQISYLAAYELVKNKRFEEAIVAMQSFAEKYPNGGYTANAQYWLGELYMVKQNYPAAIQHFDTVLQRYPTSDKAAASMLKIGYAFAATGQKNEAISRLQQVLKNYPDTNTAQLAKARLEVLNS